MSNNNIVYNNSIIIAIIIVFYNIIIILIIKYTTYIFFDINFTHSLKIIIATLTITIIHCFNYF